MYGIFVALAIVVTGTVAWYLFDDDMIAIRKHTRKGRASKIAGGEASQGESGKEALFILTLAAIFIAGIFWLAVFV